MHFDYFDYLFDYFDLLFDYFDLLFDYFDLCLIILIIYLIFLDFDFDFFGHLQNNQIHMDWLHLASQGYSRIVKSVILECRPRGILMQNSEYYDRQM